MRWRHLVYAMSFGIAGLLASPLVDAFLTQTQPRFIVLHLPAWLGLGYLAGRLTRRTRSAPSNPLGLTGLVFFVGSLAFWMIPRSIDSAVLSRGVDQLLHVDLLVAGFVLSRSVIAMPFVLRAATGLYGASMAFALGAFYTHYSALLCGTFTLAQQKQTGHALYVLSVLIVVAGLVSGARALAGVSPSPHDTLIPSARLPRQPRAGLAPRGQTHVL